jgi:hypothetical protein
MALARRPYIRDIITTARIIAAVAIIAAGGAWLETWHHILAMITLAVLTWPVRAVRWGTLFNLLLLGMLNALVIVGVQWVVEGMILGNRFAMFRSVWIAPVTEEPLKVLPLLLLLAVKRWPFRHGFGAVDLMMCGFALGAGFGVVEDALRAPAGFAYADSPRLFDIPVFLDSYNHFIGHGGAAAFIALSVGWAIWCFRWKKLAIVAPVVVMGTLYWMMADHGLANYTNYTSFSSWPAVFRWTYQLDGRGALAPYVLFALLLVTMTAERVALWRVLRPIPRLGVRPAIAMIFRPLRKGISYDSLRAVVMRTRRLGLYVFAVRQIGFLALHRKGDRPMNRVWIDRLLLMRAKEVTTVQMAVRRR